RSVSIIPARPTTTPPQTHTLSLHDALPISVTYTYVWKKNGTAIAGQTGSTLNLATAGNGDKGDSITVDVTPNDGTANGSAVASSAVDDANAPPARISVAITPPLATTNQTLT